MKREMSVYIDKNAMGMVNIYFVEERANGMRAIAQPIQLVMKEQRGDCAIIEPSLSLDPHTGHAFLSAFANALAESDFKTEKDAKLLGTLEATRDHLEDMRGILQMKKVLPEDREIITEIQEA